MFNLEECMNNEFLRPRENRCKWFHVLGVMRMWVYIERSGKCKITAKNNIVNWFTKCVNWFRHKKYKPEPYEDLYDSMWMWIDLSEPRMKKPTRSPKDDAKFQWRC